MIKEIEYCPWCEWLHNQKTNNCHLRNPIFDCKYGLLNIPHTHRWCRYGHMWVERHDLDLDIPSGDSRFKPKKELGRDSSALPEGLGDAS